MSEKGETAPAAVEGAERGLWERHNAKVLLGSVTSSQLSDCFWGRNRQALAFREALVTCISSLN